MRTNGLACAIIAALCVVSALPASGAVGDPRRLATSPSDRAFVKSVNVPSVSATYDLDLAAPPVSQIQVLDKNSAPVPGSARLADDQRTLIFTPTLPFKDQTSSGPVKDRTIEYTVQLFAVTSDQSGSAGTQFTFTVDDIAPDEPLVYAPQPDSFSRATDVLFEGGSEPRASITFREGSHAFGPIKASPEGGWYTVEPFAQGPHTVTATTVDQAGNPSARASTIRFIVDSIPPASPLMSTPVDGMASSSDAITFSGTGEPGTMIAIREAANVRGQVAVASNHTWSLGITFPKGAHTIDAIALDAAGNTSTPTTAITFSVAVAGPPVITTPVEGASIGQTSVIILGVADAGAAIDIVEGTTAVAHTTAQSDGAWSTTIVSSEGPHAIVATATDPDTSVRNSAARAFTVDLTAPDAPTFSYPGDGAYSNLDPLPVSGHGEPRAIVRVYEGVVQRGFATAGASGSWSFLTSIPDGTHVLEGTATDAAGHTSARASFTVTIDRERPVTSISTDDNSLLTSGQTITGHANDNVGVARVVVQLFDVRGTLAATLTAHRDADPVAGVVWSADPGATLPGYYRVIAFAYDRAGNAAATSPITLVLA